MAEAYSLVFNENEIVSISPFGKETNKTVTKNVSNIPGGSINLAENSDEAAKKLMAAVGLAPSVPSVVVAAGGGSGVSGITLPGSPAFSEGSISTLSSPAFSEGSVSVSSSPDSSAGSEYAGSLPSSPVSGLGAAGGGLSEDALAKLVSSTGSKESEGTVSGGEDADVSTGSKASEGTVSGGEDDVVWHDVGSDVPVVADDVPVVADDVPVVAADVPVVAAADVPVVAAADIPPPAPAADAPVVPPHPPAPAIVSDMLQKKISVLTRLNQKKSTSGIKNYPDKIKEISGFIKALSDANTDAEIQKALTTIIRSGVTKGGKTMKRRRKYTKRRRIINRQSRRYK